MPLLPGPIWSGVVIFVKSPIYGQIELHNHLLKIIIIWNHITVYKLFALDKNTW